MDLSSLIFREVPLSVFRLVLLAILFAAVFFLHNKKPEFSKSALLVILIFVVSLVFLDIFLGFNFELAGMKTLWFVPVNFIINAVVVSPVIILLCLRRNKFMAAYFVTGFLITLLLDYWAANAQIAAWCITTSLCM